MSMKVVKPRIRMPYFEPSRSDRLDRIKKTSDPAVGDYKLSDKGFELTRTSPRKAFFMKNVPKCYTGTPLSNKTISFQTSFRARNPLCQEQAPTRRRIRLLKNSVQSQLASEGGAKLSSSFIIIPGILLPSNEPK